MTNIILHGCNGKMGKVLQSILAADPDTIVVAGIDSKVDPDSDFPQFSTPKDCTVPGDVVIDFSHHTAVTDLIDWCLWTKTPAVICTTALGEETLNQIQLASAQVALFRSANMSLGINLLAKMMAEIVPVLEDAFFMEIIEKHHALKADSPSGTALLLADAINQACTTKKEFLYGRHSKQDQCKLQELGIHAVRGGTIPGEHTILFAGNDELIEVTHTALSKNVFANGAVKAARFLHGKPAGLYSMKDLL